MRARIKNFLLTHIATTWNGALPPPVSWALICWYLLRPFLKGV